jgi:hypothetical protein
VQAKKTDRQAQRGNAAVVKEKKETEDEVASSTTPHQTQRMRIARIAATLQPLHWRRKGQADDAPLRRRPRAPIGASSRRVNAGAVRALSLSGIFGPDQGTSRPSSPFCIKIFTASNLFAGFRLATGTPFLPSFYPCTPHVTLRIAPTRNLSNLLPPDQSNLVMGSRRSAAAVPDRLHREHGRSTRTVSHNWFQRLFNQNFYASQRQATAEFDWTPPCRNTRTAPFQILLAAEACI